METVRGLFIIFYGLGAVAYAVFAVVYCRKLNKETAVRYLNMAISLARQQKLELVLCPHGKCLVRSGALLLTPKWSPERCYRFLADLRNLREKQSREAVL